MEQSQGPPPTAPALRLGNPRVPTHKGVEAPPLPPSIRSVGPALSDRDKCNAQGSVQQLPKSPPLNTGQSRCSAVL